MRPVYRCRRCGVFTEEPVHCGQPCELVLDGKRRLMLSKLLSGLLRHFPHEIGLRLREDGFTEVDVEELARLIRTRWRNKELYSWIRGEHILAVAMTDPKGRFEVKDGRIRARYGHSIRVKVELPEVKNPPKYLYHGTTPEALPRILREGLKPMRRLKVHLTDSIEEAIENARRRTQHPVVLRIDAERAIRRGLRIFKAGKHVYVIDYVPPDLIEVHLRL